MEAVGAAAAVVELVSVVSKTSQHISDICQSKKYLTTVIKGVGIQLELLQIILNDLQSKGRTGPTHSHNGKDLSPILQELSDEVAQVNILLHTVEESAKGPKFFKRAVVIIRGFATQFKLHLERLERTKSALVVYLAKNAVDIASSQFTQQDRIQRTIKI